MMPLSGSLLLPFAATLLLVAGCADAGGHKPAPAEPALAAQAAAVRAGKTDQIQVEQTPLRDGDLAELAGLAGLRVLQLDHPASAFTAAGIKQLAGLNELEHLRIRGNGIDDAAIAELAQLKTLQILNLPHATITDAGLSALQQLPSLVQLRLSTPHVTNAGIKTLAELPLLTRLHLIDVPITDDGLQTLSQMTQLESLYIDGGAFSDKAVDDLFRTRPKLHVHLNQQHHDRDPQKHD